MADLSQLERALVNADAAGDTEAARTLASEITRLRSVPQEKPKVTLGPEGFAESVRQELSLNAGPLDRLAMGVSGSLDDAAMRLKQLTARSPGPVGAIAKLLGMSGELTPTEQQAAIGNRVNREGLEGMTGAVLGNLAMTGTPAAAMQRGITGAIAGQAPGMVARTVAPTVAAGVTGATLADATTPVLPGESDTKNAAYGFAGGAAGDFAGRVLGRVFQGVKPTAQAQQLMEAGVQPTIGQSAGAGSWLGQMEQKLQSIPIVGDLIRGSRNRATGEMNVAAIRSALPLDRRGEITAPGRESIDKAHTILSDGYNTVLDRIGRVQVDNAFASELSQIPRNPDIALPPEMQRKFVQIISQQFNGRMTNGEMPAEVAKRIDSNLGMLQRRYTRSGDGDDRALGQAIADAQDSFRGLFRRNASPNDAVELRNLDGFWANLIRVERAAGSQGAEQGVFTPSQFSGAVRGFDPSRNKSAYARGNARMQEFSDAARAVLGNTVPDSGTAGRLLTGGMALAAGANEYKDVSPGWVTAALLSPLLYSRMGSQALTGQLTPEIVRALQAVGPASTNIGSYLWKEQAR